MTGLAMLQQIRGLPASPRMRYILITARDVPFSIRRPLQKSPTRSTACQADRSHALDLPMTCALVYRAAYRLVGSHAAAQDVQQDLFLRLLQRPPPTVRSWPAFLTAATVRLALNHLRRQRPGVAQ